MTLGDTLRSVNIPTAVSSIYECGRSFRIHPNNCSPNRRHWETEGGSHSPKVTQLCPMPHTGYSEPLSSSLSISIKRHLISTTSQWWESLKETMLLSHIGQMKDSKNVRHCITVVIAVIVIIQQLCETKFMNPFLQKRSQKFQKLKQFSPAPQKIR